MRKMQKMPLLESADTGMWKVRTMRRMRKMRECGNEEREDRMKREREMRESQLLKNYSVQDRIIFRTGPNLDRDRSSPFCGTDGLGSVRSTDLRSVFGLP